MGQLEELDGTVQKYLTEMGLSPVQSNDGLYLFKYGSTVVMVSLFEENTDTYCRFASIMLKDFEPSLELLHHLLRLNTEVLFGSFLLFEDNTLSFSSTLLGGHMDFPEFQKTLSYVAKVSDDYDDQLQTMGGGKRAQDVLNEEDR
jgi:hypothetical protein